ncbi:helix-turn-helix domain-containing protein [Halegenticoccus soli]|uniref:helix-turn-helix domain-containing protein n=1 Tax=Halegenticoccus soli TaxID=1985678 RepID=UPI000C6DA46F|nr:helix-turn-helix domain-containing protein [Halegenticoccus soli]
MILARFTTDAPLFGDALRRNPGTSVELDATFVTAADSLRVLFWAAGDDLAAFQTALEAEPAFDGVRVVTDDGTTRLYGADGTAESVARSAYDKLVDIDAKLLRAVGTSQGWDVDVRVPGRDGLRELWEWFAERRISFQIRSIGSASRTKPDLSHALTPAQREALVLAYDRGYYSIPREAGLAHLAAELDISEQALSERLRRGYARLVGNFLDAEPE